MKDETCIFCKIANGEIPSRTIYEDGKFRVFLDLSPAAKGHALIVPKEHYADLYELPEELAADAMRLAKKEMAVMTQKLACDGFQLVQNNGETAGQTIFHFHLHLIPRYRDDGQQIAWKPGSMSDGDLDEVKDQIVS